MYRAYVEQSHVFVGIYWQRYGWVAPGMDVSGLEDEYHLAAGKPMLLYLKRPAPDLEPRLQALIDTIRASGTASYRTFATAKELERLLSEDLAVLLSESFRTATDGAVDARPFRAARLEPETQTAAELSTGTVTFLFTDIEGSTQRWERVPDAMTDALSLHDRILRAGCKRNHGMVFSTMGDGMAFAFPSAVDAVRAVIEVQRELLAAEWPGETGALAVRMGLHTDEASLRDGHYLNQPLNRCARLMATAHGGQMLISDATEALARTELPEGVALRDLGEHRLRDLAEPVHIFQLVHEALRSTFPPLRALEQPGNLPLPRTSFVGRLMDIATVHEGLDRSHLVTITGPGGAGKTRLALEAASKSNRDFRDGCWFCELAPAADGEAAVQAVAASLGVARRFSFSLQASLVDFAKPKEMLIVLDNCEHVLEASAALADDLLRNCPSVRVMVTSRQRLDVEGEQVVGLGPLSVADAAATFEEIRASEAVRLFVDRAVAVRHDFILDRTNAGSIAKISRGLDGQPLAIELAAARVAVMDPSQIAGMLDSRFRLLTSGWRSADKRHQTLRATVDWSYSLLEPKEQEFFGALGVFPASFDVDGACAVVAPEFDRWEAIEGLSSLVAKSLVVRGEGVAGEPRYRLLETLRHYARERLEEAGTADERWRRLAQHEAGFAEAASTNLQGPDELAWRPRMRLELDSLQASVQWALASPRMDDSDIALRIAAALAPHAIWEGARDVAALVERAVEGARDSTPDIRRAVLGSAAFAAFQTKGDLRLAEQLAREALVDPITAACRDPASAYAALGGCLVFTGRVVEAKKAFVDAAEALEKAGVSDYHRAFLHRSWAILYSATGDFEAARSSAFEALRHARSAGGPGELSATLWSAGLATQHDRPDQALDLVEEGIALIRAGASSGVLGYMLEIRAQLRMEAGDAAGALADIREAIRFSRDKGDFLQLWAAFDHSINIFGQLRRSQPFAVITGAVDRRPVGPGRLSSKDRPRFVEEARAELGAAGYDAAMARGAAMTLDAILEFAIAETDRAATESY